MTPTALEDLKTLPGAVADAPPAKRAPLSRDAFLSSLGKLAEEDVEVDGLGTVLVREMTGKQRAQLLEVLAPAASGGKADLVRYQQMLLELGLVDPADGQPLLDMQTSADVLAGLGASKIEQLCSAIERVSGLSKSANERAEKNSETTPSSDSTSG